MKREVSMGVKMTRERERKVGENRFEYSRHAYASLSDTFNNFNPWFKYGERLASPRTKV